MSFGLELLGDGARWVFETDAVHVHYDTGLTANPLLRRLRHVRVPYEALSGVRVTRSGRGGTLCLLLRAGADPLYDLLGDRLDAASHPYRLRVGSKQVELAEYHARLLSDRITLNPEADTPAQRFLVAAPPAPPMVRCYDGRATFDGQAVVLSWARSSAARPKRRAGRQHLPVGEIAGVEWLPSRGGPGYLRFLRRDDPGVRPLAQDDPTALVLGYGHGSIADTLPFAAAVLAAAGEQPSTVDGPATGTADIADAPTSSAQPSTVEDDAVWSGFAGDTELSADPEPAGTWRSGTEYTPAEYTAAEYDTVDDAAAGDAGLPDAVPAAQDTRPRQHPDPSVTTAATIRELYSRRESGQLGEREFQERKAEVLRRR